MIVAKSLKNNGQEQISKHFKVYEFGDTSPSPYNAKKVYSDNVKYSEELIVKLEELIEITGAKSVTVSSGYRSRQHDKDVGGSGYGQHPNGCAADVCFIGQNGKPIDNRVISVIAQDIGIKGIARINKNGYIHLDMRAKGTYLGDETIHNYTVTWNFREYYKLSDADISKILDKQYGKPTTYYEGIDYALVYDKDYYLAKYADLQQAFGDNPTALIKHFVEHGMSEGRKASANFDINAYRKYADLQQAFGDDLKAYYLHYIQYGMSEGRKCVE